MNDAWGIGIAIIVLLIVGAAIGIALFGEYSCKENYSCQPVPELVDCKNQCAPNDFEYKQLSLIDEGWYFTLGIESPSGCYCIEKTKVK